jgi:hypothetical protein
MKGLNPKTVYIQLPLLGNSVLQLVSEVSDTGDKSGNQSKITIIYYLFRNFIYK